MPRRLTLVLVATTTAFAAAVAWSAPAFGHAAFVGSTPAAGVRLEASPSQLSLSFTEPLNRRLSKATVVAMSGGAIPLKVRAPTPRRLELTPAAPLARGAYRVKWHTVSTEDGHALEGSYSFGVRAAAVGGEHSVEQSPLARDGWLRVVLRGVLYVAALMLVAALLPPLLVPGARGRWLVPDTLSGSLDVVPVRDRQRNLTADLAWLAVGAAVATTLAEAADAAGGLSPARLGDFLLANQPGVARLAVVGSLLACALLWRGRPRTGAVLATLALGAVAASGHASSASPRVPSILNDWLHLVGGALWLGGIALLVLTWGPTLRRAGRRERLAVARHVLPGFGRVALPAFLLASTTGVVSLLTQLGHLDALWTTAYGRVLMAKMTLVGLIALVSANHALRLRPQLLAANPHASDAVERRHWRLLRTEPVLGLGVVIAVAFLVAFPLPPRQLGEAGDAEARAAAPACDPCPLPRPTADELAVADRAGSKLVAAWVRRDRGQVSGTVRVLDSQGKPSPARFAVDASRTSTCGRGCQRFRAPAATGRLAVAVQERGRRYVALLPTRWRRHPTGEARRLLSRAQRTMRDLRSVREVEEVTSGPGSYGRTVYRVRAPNRMTYRTTSGTQSVVIGRREWVRTRDSGWDLDAYGGGLTFRTRTWFRWTSYGRSVQLLGVFRRERRRVAELALMDEGTPAWLRLTVDLSTHRVLVTRMAAPAHFMRTRFLDFNQPMRIEAPQGRHGR